MSSMTILGWLKNYISEVSESADMIVFVGDIQNFWQQHQRWMEIILSIYFPNDSLQQEFLLEAIISLFIDEILLLP